MLILNNLFSIKKYTRKQNTSNKFRIIIKKRLFCIIKFFSRININELNNKLK